MDYRLLVLTFAFAVWQTARADCLDLPGIPLGTESLEQSKGKSCGYSALITGINGQKDVDELGLTDWFHVDFSSTHFAPVGLPLGSLANCPEYASAEDLTSWPGPSKVYVRREMEIPAESLAMLQDVEVTYMVDDKMLNVYMNEKKVTVGPRSPGRGCGYWAAKNKFTIPASFLKAGKNVLAVEAVDFGGTAYLDLGLSFRACSDSIRMADLHPCSAIGGPAMLTRGCRARCDEENYCRNKNPEDCGASYVSDVSGGCYCMAAESLSCSGPVADVAAGVCYESEWLTSQVSRMSFCSPMLDTTCRAESELVVDVPATLLGKSSANAVIKVSTPAGAVTGQVPSPAAPVNFPLGTATSVDLVTVTSATGGMVNVVEPEPSQELIISAQQACVGRASQFINFGAVKAAAPFTQWDPNAFSNKNGPTLAGSRGVASLPAESQSVIYFKKPTTYKLVAGDAADTCLLKLSFTETYFSAVRKRIFTVRVRGAEEARFDNLDVLAKVGKHKIFEIILPTVQPNDSGAIEVDFIPGSVNWPIIASMVLCC